MYVLECEENHRKIALRRALPEYSRDPAPLFHPRPAGKLVDRGDELIRVNPQCDRQHAAQVVRVRGTGPRDSEILKPRP